MAMAPMMLPPPSVLGIGGAAPGAGAGTTAIGPRIEEPSRLVYHLPPLSAEPGTQDSSVDDTVGLGPPMVGNHT